MVLFKDNFDNIVKELVVLLFCYFNLFVNGVSGIFFGFVIEILMYNLCEVIDVCIVVMEKLFIELDEIMMFMKGLDFFIGGLIMGGEGILDVYWIGKGRIYICFKMDIENMCGGKQQIVIIEILYQVVKFCFVIVMENI